MGYRKVIGFLLCLSVLAVSCKKDDPEPLPAQKQAVLLAGQSGQSKSWRLIGLTQSVNNGAAQSQTLSGCYGDNQYTFSNNTSQDYEASEGASKCNPSGPTIIESGTWAFTIDGLILTVMVDDVQSLNGLFTVEPDIYYDDGGTPDDPTDDVLFPYNVAYPYPAFVSTLTETSMVLELNYTVATTKIKYVLTFTVAV